MNFLFMKEYMKSFLFCLMIFPVLVHANIVDVYETANSRKITYDQFINKMRRAQIIVLGEFHNNDSIQQAQGKIIEDVVQDRRLFGNFNVGWEFLNFSEQVRIDLLFRKVFTNIMTITDFITQTAGKQNLSYAPIIQALKNKSGKLLGINIEREIKQKLINEGEDAIKEHLPSNYEVGGDLYQERFFKAMGGHVPEDLKLPYFKAQCLTDSIMSYKIVENHNLPLSFLVAGSFHTDFYQGTVSRIKKLTSDDVRTLKIVDSSILTETELQDILDGDAINGKYADFIIITAP